MGLLTIEKNVPKGFFAENVYDNRWSKDAGGVYSTKRFEINHRLITDLEFLGHLHQTFWMSFLGQIM